MKILCGEDICLWDDIRQTLLLHPKFDRTPGAIVVSAKDRYLNPKSHEYIGHLHPEIRLVRMIATWSDQQCSDPRDKIYALLGLLQGDDLISVDYSTTGEDLFSQILSIVNLRSRLSSNEVRRFCVTLQASLEVCPTNTTVSRAIVKALSAHHEIKHTPMVVEDFSRKHIMRCESCGKRMQSQHSRFDRNRGIIMRPLGDETGYSDEK